MSEQKSFFATLSGILAGAGSVAAVGALLVALYTNGWFGGEGPPSTLLPAPDPSSPHPPTEKPPRRSPMLDSEFRNRPGSLELALIAFAPDGSPDVELAAQLRDAFSSSSGIRIGLVAPVERRSRPDTIGQALQTKFPGDRLRKWADGLVVVDSIESAVDPDPDQPTIYVARVDLVATIYSVSRVERITRIELGHYGRGRSRRSAASQAIGRVAEQLATAADAALRSSAL